MGGSPSGSVRWSAVVLSSLLGESVHRTRSGLGATLICVGAAVGVPATLWTLVVPAFAVVVMVLALKRYDAQNSPAAGQPPGAGAA